MSFRRSMSSPSRRCSIDPKSTHHEQRTARAVQNTASSRTLAGSLREADCSMVSWTALATSSRGWGAATAKGSGTSPKRRLAYLYMARMSGLARFGGRGSMRVFCVIPVGRDSPRRCDEPQSGGWPHPIRPPVDDVGRVLAHWPVGSPCRRLAQAGIGLVPAGLDGGKPRTSLAELHSIGNEAVY